MIRFEDPWLLFLLIIIPLMIVYQRKGIGRKRVLFSSLNNLKKLRKSTSLFLRKIILILRCVAIVLLIISLARPQSGSKTEEILTEGIDIILCLDTSGSMQAADFNWQDDLNLEGTIDRQTRLQVVKKVVRDFIERRMYDPIGMVVFGEEAFTQCPLTLDYGVLLNFLDQLEIGMAGDSTAIGSALGICIKRLKNRTSKSKVIILLTDGRNNTGSVSPITAAIVAKMFAIRTYTIGVGKKEKPPPLGGTFSKDYLDQFGSLDEYTLKKIAAITEGEYFKATNAKALVEIYNQIDRLEKTELKIKEHMNYRELFIWFLLSGLACILLEIILANTHFRKIP